MSHSSTSFHCFFGLPLVVPSASKRSAITGLFRNLFSPPCLSCRNDCSLRNSSISPHQSSHESCHYLFCPSKFFHILYHSPHAHFYSLQLPFIFYVLNPQPAEHRAGDRNARFPGSLLELALRRHVLGNTFYAYFPLGPSSLLVEWPILTKDLQAKPKEGALQWYGKTAAENLIHTNEQNEYPQHSVP